MRVVVGIDAAWTAHNPSGVAVALDDGRGWCLVAAAPSFPAFHALAGSDPATGFDAALLLADATRLAGAAPSLVAIDMPLMNGLITRRRVSDNAISARYGGRGAGTHSPSALRPGPLAVAMLDSLTREGYPLLCQRPIASPSTIEVYPHPALIELTGAARRLPYKVHNRGKYWPNLSPADRLAALFAQWRHIVAALDAVLPGSAARLLPPLPDAPKRTRKPMRTRSTPSSAPGSPPWPSMTGPSPMATATAPSGSRSTADCLRLPVSHLEPVLPVPGQEHGVRPVSLIARRQ